MTKRRPNGRRLFYGYKRYKLRDWLDCPPKLTEDYGRNLVLAALLHSRHE